MIYTVQTLQEETARKTRETTVKKTLLFQFFLPLVTTMVFGFLVYYFPLAPILEVSVFTAVLMLVAALIAALVSKSMAYAALTAGLAVFAGASFKSARHICGV